MTNETQQPTGSTLNPVKSAIIVTITTLIITSLIYLAPDHWLTGAIIVSLTVGLIAYVWILSREFSLRCLSIASTALFALLSNNIIPNFKITGNWGEKPFGFKIESIDVNLNWILGIIIIVFGVLALLWRIFQLRRSQLPGVKEIKTTGPKSPIINSSGDDNEIIGGNKIDAEGDAAGRDINKTEIHIDQSGSKLDQSVIDRLLKTIDEKDDHVTTLKGEISEKDDLIQKLKDGFDRVVKEAEKGEPAAQDAINELRKSGDTEKLQRVLEKEADQHKDDFIERCSEIAAIAYFRGDIDTARKRIEDVLKLDPDNWKALNLLGLIEILQGHLDAAESIYRRILKVGEQFNNMQQISVASDNLGIVLQTRGDLGGAEKMYHTALEIYDKLELLEGKARSYNNLGEIKRLRDDLDGAEKMYDKALVINKKLNRIIGMSHNYGNLGIILYRCGKLDGAEKMYRKSLEINKKLSRLEGMAINYGNLGIVLRKRGDLDGAEKMYCKALKIDENLRNLEGIAADYCNLGNVNINRSEKDKAKEYLLKARDLYKQIGMQLELEQVQGWIDELEKPDGP